ncbi:condensation domain-containing protein [Allorhizocola rhizosphaerae]|uniref:condensation domain-containing protein n=1 Tax=Allorhizocola rhizosphaerae TaxID=1872709 RepID=UPI000E3D277C|nr:condensation domain-containing protein [Allorhizocola rhizosphaerae]
MDLVLAERVPVPFEGDDGGTGELSWGQQSVWQEMEESGVSLAMTAVRELPPGAEVKEFVTEFAFYLSRYQAMRTLLRFEPDGRVLQVVERAGSAEIEVYDAAGHDPADIAAQVGEHYMAKVFDYAHEWPMRWALVRHDGVLTHAVVALAHHVADPTSAMAMIEDLRDRDPVTGEPPRPPGIQPLEQARRQQEPPARRQNDAALRYWEEQLRVIPPSMFAAEDPGRRYPGRFWQVDFSSPALYLALRAVAARLGVTTGAVLFAAFSGALSRVIGLDPVALTVTVNTRFRPGLSGAAGPMTQLGLCTLQVGELGFDELVRAARRRLLVARKHSYYSPLECERVIERVGRERGVAFDLRCMFNDRRVEEGPIQTIAGEAEMRAALAATKADWKEVEGLHQVLMIHVNDHPAALEALVQVDTAYAARADIAEVLRRMESMVLDAAVRRAVR